MLTNRARQNTKLETKPAPGRPRARALAVAALLGATALMASTEARADDVSPTGKGIVGGALLGAEVVTITESIIGVRSTWAYLGGGVLGAAGGGVGGYFIEQGSSDGRAPVYLLAGGLALAIPAIVLTLNATRYMPSEGATEDRAPTNVPAADPGKAGGSTVVPASGPPATTPAPPPGPPPVPPPAPAGGGAPLSLLDVGASTLRVGVPIPEVREVFSAAERRQIGMAQVTELRLPVLKVTF